MKRKETFWLLRNSLTEFDHYNLPSKDAVLRYFLHLHVTKNKTVQESAREIAKRILEIGNRRKILCIEEHNIIKKVKKIYDSYQDLKRNKSSNCANQVEKRKKILNKLSSHFHVDYSNGGSCGQVDHEKKQDSFCVKTKM